MKFLIVTLWAIVLVFACFGTADVMAYDAAKFPERTQCAFCMVPGGGFYALWKYGSEKDYKPCETSERSKP